VVDFGGVLVNGRGCLGAEVAVARIEVERADMVRAVSTGELHSALDTRDGVEAVHILSVVFWRESGRHGGEAAKVMRRFKMGKRVMGKTDLLLRQLLPTI
jgi:hypothetical protein